MPILNMKVVPAILTSDINELKSTLQRCEGIVDRVQIDIIDGVFADNKTIDPASLESIETELFLDFHLMVKEPVNWVERCARAGGARIIGQIEHMANQIEFIEKVQEVGAEAGLAVDLPTAVSTLELTAISSVDCVLVMSVPAGFGEQEFDASALLKVKELNKIRDRDGMSFSIIDDGGITFETVDDTKRVGVDEVAIGRRLFEGDLKENIERMIKAAYSRD
jgi:ribulose-phosphate 3-epimerase